MAVAMTLRNEMFLLFFVLTWMLASSDIYKSVMWTTNNPYFQNSNTSELKSECLGGTLQMKVHLKSVLPIVCPFEFIIMQTLPSSPSTGVLYENIWIVYDKQSFESCNVNLTAKWGTEEEIKKGKELRNKKLYDCNTPDTLKNYRYNIDFKEKSPVMNGVYFEAGKTYYFLATSDGTPGSLNQTSGGHCNNDGDKKIRMKFQVYVCGTSDPNCTNTDEIGKFKCLRPYTSSPSPSPSTSPSVSSIVLSTSSSSRSSSVICTCPSYSQHVEPTPSYIEPTASVQPSYYSTELTPTTAPAPFVTNCICDNDSLTGGKSARKTVNAELVKSRDNWRAATISFLIAFLILVIVILIYTCYKYKLKKKSSPCDFFDIKTVRPEDSPPYDKAIENDKKDLIIPNAFSHTNSGFNEVDGAKTPKSENTYMNTDPNTQSSTPDEGIEMTPVESTAVEMTPVATGVSQGKWVQDKANVHAQPHANIMGITQSNGTNNASLMNKSNDNNQVPVRNGEAHGSKTRRDLTSKKRREKAKESLPPLKIPHKTDNGNPRKEPTLITNGKKQDNEYQV